MKSEDTSKWLISGALYLQTSDWEPKARSKVGIVKQQSPLSQHNFVEAIRGCCLGVERTWSRWTRRMLTKITEKTWNSTYCNCYPTIPGRITANVHFSNSLRSRIQILLYCHMQPAADCKLLIVGKASPWSISIYYWYLMPIICFRLSTSRIYQYMDDVTCIWAVDALNDIHWIQPPSCSMLLLIYEVAATESNLPGAQSPCLYELLRVSLH